MSNGQTKGAYEQQERQIAMKSGDFLNMLTRTGLVPERIEDQDWKKAKQAKIRNRYHNTMLLLKHYRDIRWLLQCLPAHVAEELDMPYAELDMLLSAVSTKAALESKKFESRMRSIEKSRLMMDRINEAITVLREKPGDGEQLYNIIFHTFISPQKLKHQQLLDKLEISDRHYYRMRQQAVNILSIRLWATPAAELDSWLELLSLLEIM